MVGTSGSSGFIGSAVVQQHLQAHARKEAHRTKRRICIVVAHELTVRAFLAPHLRALQSHYDVTVVVNTTNVALLEELGVEGTLVPLRIERYVAPWCDLTALWSLYRLLRAGCFDVVHSMTPKAGLLAMTAAWLARIPVRIHTFTGQVWVTHRGPARSTLRAFDTVVARLATTTLADSPSQRDFLVREGISAGDAVRVLGKGSVCGVDSMTFRPNGAVRQAVRARLNIPSSDIVLLFVGRLTNDKGVLDLAGAFLAIADERQDVHLLLVGPDESRLRSRVESLCARHAARLRFIEFTARPQDFMAAADVLCLPSYREGFGSVVIEAAACGVPAVASRIYGLVDAVEEGRTGLLHAPHDVQGLAELLRRLADDSGLRRTLGEAARCRAEADFPVSRLTNALLSFYAEMLAGVAHRGFYRRFGKRAVDVVVASFALVLATPLLVAIGMLVRVTLGAPLLFRQRRPGLNGIPFTLVKFRSMTDRYDGRGRALPDGERLTRIGRFLRASSLDELPELWNVLKGDMSLVGPRPLLLEYMPLYSDEQARRHQVRPGITGLAQVNGRNGLSWPERLALDVQYVERCSLWMDIGIVGRTLWDVLGARGINQPGRATVDYFRGNAGVDG
jgi:lipopolysaccharide/colanic/teichoic acid biosynthesis glycosyltransferase/glycosyltransferase involved in cell wall biosynthesis